VSAEGKGFYGDCDNAALRCHENAKSGLGPAAASIAPVHIYSSAVQHKLAGRDQFTIKIYFARKITMTTLLALHDERTHGKCSSNTSRLAN
jgi:hypothetical protein